jgi:hypothetical protein
VLLNIVLPREVRGRALRAGVSALASLIVFAIECAALAFIMPNMSELFL